MTTNNPIAWNDRPAWTRITLVVFGIVTLLTYARLFIGVDVTDEGFHSSVPYSFALGVRPYRDELHITQNSGIFLFPFYKIHQWVFGSSFGLILFNRHLYFILLCACSYLSYRVGTAYLTPNFGRLLAAFTLTFSYFNIPSLSYNTLGSLFLFAGLFLLLYHASPERSKRPHWLIFAANSCFALCAFTYPSLLLSSIIGIGCSLWLATRAPPAEPPIQKRHNLNAWAASVALGIVAAVGFALYFGVANIEASIAYARLTDHDLMDAAPRKTGYILGQLSDLKLYAFAFAGVVFLPVLPIRSYRQFPRVCLSAVFAVSGLLVYLVHRQPSLASYPSGSTPLVLCIGLLLPIAAVLIRDRSIARTLVWVIVVPSFAGAAAVSYSSTNCLTAATLGLFPACVASLLCLGLIARNLDLRIGSGGLRSGMVLAGWLPILAFQTHSLLERSYMDAPFASGSRPVFAPGPYAGILTKAPNARGLALVISDLNSVGSAQTLFINGEFPGGYLLSKLKPSTFCTWMFLPNDASATAELFKRVFASDRLPPDVIMQIGETQPWIESHIERLDYRIHLRRPELGYVLLVRSSG